MAKINVKNTDLTIIQYNNEDYRGVLKTQFQIKQFFYHKGDEGTQRLFIVSFVRLFRLCGKKLFGSRLGFLEPAYICITDLARYKNSEHTDDVIKNWLRNRNTIELLGIWEYLHNPNSKPVEFDGFKTDAGSNYFVLFVCSVR
jgi:hypothetical protein